MSDNDPKGFFPDLTDDELAAMPDAPKLPDVPLVTDTDIWEWTSTHGQMAWGQVMIPEHVVTAYVRGLRDKYEAALLAAPKSGSPLGAGGR